MRRFSQLAAALAAGLLGFGLVNTAGANELTDLLWRTLDNPAIEARTSQDEAARRDLDAADLRYLGSGGVFAGRTHFEGPRVVGIFTPILPLAPIPVAQDINQYGVAYTLPVDVFGVIAAERAKARADQQSAELLARQETLLRLHQTLSAYVQLQALAQQAAALRTQQEELDAYATRVRTEVKLGSTAGLDESLVQSDLAQLDAQQTVLAGNRGAALASLQAASGAITAALSATITIPRLMQADTQASLPGEIARAQSHAAEAVASKARLSLLPAFSGNAQYAQYNGAGVNRDFWSVGVNMTIPLDAAAYRSESAAAARAQAAADQVRAVQNDTVSQIAALNASYQAALANTQALETEVGHRTQVVAVEREKWRLGASTMEDLLRQERDRLDAQFQLADAEAQAAVAWSSIQVLQGATPATYIQTWSSKR
ncbi:MAG: TolC family protein [Sulfuriferula sp.]